MAAKLTPEACRAGRAILKWSVRDLAREADVSPTTVNLLERDRPFRAETEARIVDAFRRHNVEITNGEGTGARKGPYWRIGRPKVGEGFTAHRFPHTDDVAPVCASIAAIEAWLRASGFSQVSQNSDEWFDAKANVAAECYRAK